MLTLALNFIKSVYYKTAGFGIETGSNLRFKYFIFNNDEYNDFYENYILKNQMTSSFVNFTFSENPANVSVYHGEHNMSFSALPENIQIYDASCSIIHLHKQD